ncbi:MAG: J domain-containing protein [Acidobacteria bacterium]|nr:J domain-containing protein [Acidobacteriota bacterium]
MADPSNHASGAAPKEGSLRLLLKRVHLREQSGIVEVELAGETRRFYFIGGDLFLVDGHALAQRLAALLGPGAGSAVGGLPGKSPEERRELKALVSRIAGFLAQLEVGKARFLEGQELPENLVGPLPTGLLVMEMAVLGVGPDEILARLGGPKSRIVAQAESYNLEEHGWLETEEAFLLSRLEVPMEVGNVLTHMGLGREVALRAIERLQALELVGFADRPKAKPAVAPPRSLVSPDVLKRFLQRIGASLQDRPSDLDYEEHRQFLGDLMATLGEKDHYDLLELRHDAKPEQIHASYERLARRVHPFHGQRLGLAGREKALELLFERATEAYLTLSDPKRRASYDQRMGLSVLDIQEDDADTRHRELAREYFQMARKMVDSQQYHAAHELLRDAARRDPRPEYWGLLAQVQAKNPNWLRRAVESYRRAVELAPGSVDLRLGLALTCEKANFIDEAKLQFESVLSRMPGHPAASAGLERLAGVKEEGKSSGGGFLSRLFSRFTKSGS